MPTEELIEFNLGALIDTRPEEEKQKDHSIVEIVASVNAVNWVEKPEYQWRKFQEQNQVNSGSCVAQTVKKMNQVNMWLKYRTLIEFSATSIFQLRINRPGDGMIGINAFDIWSNTGISLEALVPSDKMNNQQIDSAEMDRLAKEVALSFRISGHSGIPLKDIETVASVIQTTGKAVMVWFYFTSQEWSPLVPEVLNPGLDLYGQYTARHSVTAVDYFLYRVNGKLVKCLLIEDSAHFGGRSRRIITEDFFKARNWFTRWATTYKFVDSTTPETNPTPNAKPKYIFNTNLEFIPLDKEGNIGDLVKNEQQSKDVKALQDILKYEGLFPVNQASTGYYGALTAKGVLKFQEKHNVATPQEISSLLGRKFGPATRAEINSIYG